MDRRSNIRKANKSNPDQWPLGFASITQTDTHTLVFEFNDGLKGSIDFLPIIEDRVIWDRFKDAEQFKKWRLDITCTVLEWPGNIMDFYYMQLRNFLIHGHWSTH